jgi:hypothetical protein
MAQHNLCLALITFLSVLHGTEQFCLALFVSLWKWHIHSALSNKLVATLSLSYAVTDVLLTF